MAEIIKMGSLYLNGAPVDCGSQVNDKALSIGDTHPDHKLTWVKVNGLLVADHVVCTNVSWEYLNSIGFIRGAYIWIDKNPYLCRSLKTGNTEEVINEWDAILDATGVNDELWHWKDILFWGQEAPRNWKSHRVVRGWVSARSRNHECASTRNVSIGFRPALAPLISDPLISDSMVGKPIKVYCQGETIRGILSGISDYDLFLSPIPGIMSIPDCKWCCKQKDGTFVVTRSEVAIASES